MRVGIDARLLAEPVTGIGRYTAELSRELVQLEGDFRFYTPKPPVVSGWEGPRSLLRSARFPGRVGKVVWSQTVLPYWAARDRVDLFWGPTHRLPRYLSPAIARVVTIHDLVWKHAAATMRPMSRLLEQRLMPEAVRLADRVMADSQSTASALEEVFPESRGKTRVVPLGATWLGPADSFASLAVLGIDRPYILFVGTLEPRKNLRRLLAAFAALPRELSKTVLLVVAGGQGWGGVDLDTLRVEYHLEREVVVTGYVSDAQLATLYAHARFLAMPSLYEGFGLPIVEAMQYGTPVLVSDSSSLPEVAGDAGMLVDPREERSITEALAVLIKEDAARDSLAGRAKENSEKFSWVRAAREAMEVFAEAVAERRDRTRGRA